MHQFFKVLADETRLRSLALIVQHKEICVCELIYALDLPQSKISRHLAIMKLNGVIRQRREKQWVLYSLCPDLSTFKRAVIDLVLQEQENNSFIQQDNSRLLTMSERPNICQRAQ